MSGVKLGAGLLQVSDVMKFPKEEAPDNSVLWPIAFTKNSLPSTETHYSNIEREALGILQG